MNTVRLTPDDIDELKKQAILRWPGVWLHHFGHMIEEEVLRRNGFAFTPTEARVPGVASPAAPVVVFHAPLKTPPEEMTLFLKNQQYHNYQASRKQVIAS